MQPIKDKGWRFINAGELYALVLSLALLAPLSVQAETGKGYDLEACLARGLELNPTLRKLALETVLAREQVVTANGVYETRLGGTVNYEDSELPSSRALSEGAAQSLIAGAGINRRFSRGTTLGVEASANQFKFEQSQPGSPGEIDFSSVQLTLSQDLLKNAWGRQDRSRIQTAEAGYQRSKLVYLYERDRLAAEIYNAYWDAYQAEKTYAVNQAALQRSEELLEINRKKFEDGLLEETDILAAEAALATRKVEVLGRRDAVATTRDVLLQTISVPIQEWDRVPVIFSDEVEQAVLEHTVTAEAAYEVAQLARADVAAFRAAQEQALLDIEVKQDETRADLALTGGYGRGDTGINLDDSFGFDDTVWSVGLEFSVPWSKSVEQSELRQAQVRLAQVEQDMEAIHQQVLLECRLAARDVTTAVELVHATRRARNLEARKLELEQKKLAQGRSITALVIEYQDDLEFAEWSYIGAVTTFHKRWAYYQLVQGILLESNEAESRAEVIEVWP